MNDIPASNNELSVARSLGRIEGGISELKTEVSLMRQDHAKLRQEFSSLEAGRLTRLESSFAVSQAEMHIKSKTIAMWWSAIVSVVVSVVVAIIVYLLKLK